MATDFDHYTDMDLNPIADHILVENIESEDERVQNGIIIPSELGESRGVKSRWALVYLVGPEQIEVEPGQWVLIEHGRWTRGVKLANGKVVRKVDPDGLMLVSNVSPGDL